MFVTKFINPCLWRAKAQIFPKDVADAQYGVYMYVEQKYSRMETIINQTNIKIIS
jgi:hypothetical protein